MYVYINIPNLGCFLDKKVYCDGHRMDECG
jgi:hypothetical protein